MAIEVLTAIWRDPPCGGGNLLVLLALADNADEETWACWPSMATIARKAAMSERNARNCIRDLTERGLISVEIGGGNGRPSTYTILCSRTYTRKRFPGKDFPEKISQTRKNPADTRKISADTRKPASGEPLEPSLEPSLKKESARDALAAVVGDELATAFVAHRKAIRKPMTDHAGALLAKRLAQMRDPASAVARSIENGWTGVFEDSAVTHYPAKRHNDGERLDAHLDALKARLAVQRLE